MNDRLREIAQEEAELHLQGYDFLNIAEQSADLDLTDDEMEEIFQLVTHAKIVLPEETE